MPFNRHSNLFVCFAVAVLAGLGLVMLASTSVWVESDDQHYFHLGRQALWLLAGVALAAALATFDYHRLRRVWPVLLLASCALLVLCYVPGIAIERNGEARWIRVPLLGQFQPSETAKPVLVITLAAWFARYQAEARSLFKGFLAPAALLGVPLLLILFEKDMGTTLAVGAAGFAILYIAGTRLPYLLATAGAGACGFWHFVRHDPLRWKRIETWLDIENPVHHLDQGLQQWRALLAFGNGGLAGRGLGNGAVKHGYLPFAHTDFIFPVVGEELGLWFTLLTVLCYVVILVFGLLIAVHATDPFGRLIAVGSTAMLVSPAMLNIAVTTSLLPNTGLPLPFVSYGGSNLVFALACVGLLASVHRRTATIERAALLPFDRPVRPAVRL